MFYYLYNTMAASYMAAPADLSGEAVQADDEVVMITMAIIVIIIVMIIIDKRQYIYTYIYIYISIGGAYLVSRSLPYSRAQTYFRAPTLFPDPTRSRPCHSNNLASLTRRLAAGTVFVSLEMMCSFL